MRMSVFRKLRISKSSMVGLVFLVSLYPDAVFFAIENLLANHHFRRIYILYSVIFSVLALVLFLFKAASNRWKMRVIQMSFLGVICCIIFLFFCTPFRYGTVNAGWLKAFLDMEVRLVPAGAVAYILTDEDYDGAVKCIPCIVFLFVLSTTISILRAGGFGLSIDRYNSEINTYLELGYRMACAYGLNIAWLSYNRTKIRMLNLISIIMIILIPLQLISLLSLGGKGPILGACMVTGAVLISSSKGRKLLLLLVVGMLVLAPLYVPFMYQSAGIQRLLHIKTALSTAERLQLWKGAIKAGFNKIFIGNGIGAEYYLLGFHSHNILCDIFMEYGMIGFLVLIICLAIICVQIVMFVKKDRKYIILAVIFLNSIVMLMVSGYYLLNAAFWGVIAYVVINRKRLFCGMKDKTCRL